MGKLNEQVDRLNKQIEWWGNKYREQVWRAEALEAVLRDIAAIVPRTSVIQKIIRTAFDEGNGK